MPFVLGLLSLVGKIIIGLILVAVGGAIVGKSQTAFKKEVKDKANEYMK